MATKLKRPTKNDRLMQIFDMYQETVGGRPCTMEEVAAFALLVGLYPVPAQRDPDIFHLEWQTRLEKVRTEKWNP